MLTISPSTQLLVEELYAAADHGTYEEELLSLLGAIARAREPGAIPALVPLLMTARGRLEAAVASAIDGLIAATPPRLLPRLDRSLRRITSSERAGRDSWSRLGTELTWIERHPRQRVALLALASCHPNGFLRAIAVQRLAEVDSVRALPFLLLRLNDWVPAIRELARRSLEPLLTADRFVELLSLLPLVQRLEECGHDHLEWLRRFHRFLQIAADAGAVATGCHSPDPLVRRTSYVLALGQARQPLPVLLRATNDPDPRLQTWAIRSAEHLDAASRYVFAERSLGSRFPSIRHRALQLLVEHEPELAVEPLRRALTESSGALRSLARFHLPRLAPMDFGAFYRERLAEQPDAPTLGVVSGLGETGTPDDAVRLLPWLVSPRARLRAATTRAIARLAPETHRAALLERLADPSRTVSRSVAQIARRLPALFPASEIWRVFRQSQLRHVRINALRILARRDRWTSLHYLLPAAPDSDLEVAREARHRLARWCADYNRSAAVPTPDQLAALEQRLTSFGWALEPRLRETIRFSLDSWPR